MLRTVSFDHFSRTFLTRCVFLFQTEKQIREYNEMARKLKLIPPSAENANGIDFEMHFNPHSQRPDQRAHMDFKGTIKVTYYYSKTPIQLTPLLSGRGY